MRLDYHLLDVFSERQFGGNQLAVFPDPPPTLPAALMQRIAKELNLSETTFIFPPADPANDFRLRIFTPAAELPMAGHPTVGSAYLLARLGALGALAGEKTIVFEEGVGPIAATIHADNEGDPAIVWMRQPNPRFGDVVDDRAGIAAMLSLSEADIRRDAPMQVLSSGLPFLFVALKSLGAMRRLRFRQDLWAAQLQGTAAENIFVTTLETVNETSSAHSRMFAPALGIVEDPATGSASGPLGAYLLRYRLVESGEMIGEQGFEIGRPSLIHIKATGNGAALSQVAIGGRCAYLGNGALFID